MPRLPKLVVRRINSSTRVKFVHVVSHHHQPHNHEYVNMALVVAPSLKLKSYAY